MTARLHRFGSDGLGDPVAVQLPDGTTSIDVPSGVSCVPVGLGPGVHAFVLVKHGVPGRVFAMLAGNSVTVMAPKQTLQMWTVYRGAGDVPDFEFCVRPWDIGPGSMEPAGPAIGAGTLDAARALVPARFDHRLPRTPLDDPCVVETWI